MQKFISRLLAALLLSTGLVGQTLSPETVLLETPYGNMTLKLYEETPLHKANFLKLVEAHVYDSLLFHRVINEFMIQGGDPLSRHAKRGDSLGHGDLGYTVPAEIHPRLIHKKGALCAARESDALNPDFASSASQFYIVMGRPRTGEELKKYEQRINSARYNQAGRKVLSSPQGVALKSRYNRQKLAGLTDSAALVNAQIDSLVKSEMANTPEYRFSEHQVTVYTTLGGTPHLDGTYTVFGEVIDGLEVIERIASAKKDARDRPLRDLRMKMRRLQ